MNEVRDLICDMAPQTTRPVSSLLETNGCIGKPRFTEERTNIVYNANKHRKVVGLLIEDVAAIMIQTALRAFELDGASILRDAIEYPYDVLQKINALNHELKATQSGSSLTPSNNCHYGSLRHQVLPSYPHLPPVSLQELRKSYVQPSPTSALVDLL